MYLRGLVLSLACALSTPLFARAELAAPPVTSVEPDQSLGPREALDGTPLPSGHDARATAVLSLSGGAPILMPDGVSPRAAVGYMLELSFAMRLTYPVMVGVSVGRGSFGSRAESRSSALLDGGGLTLGSATASADLSLSHLSALLRYEPYWGPVRPFLELSAGPTLLWTDYGVTDARGRTVEADSDVHSFGLLSGAALGIDIPFSRDRTRSDRPAYMIDLSLTLGVRYWASTPMRHPRVDGTLGVTEARSVIQAWLPFAALTWSCETHPEVLMRHRRP